VNNPFTVAIQLSESNTGFVPTASLFTIHRTEKAKMSGSVKKYFGKPFTLQRTPFCRLLSMAAKFFLSLYNGHF